MQVMTLTQQDWMRFLIPEGLAEKSGVPPASFLNMILKELADNSADAGGATIVASDDDSVAITDTGPGIDLGAFSLKRPLQSTKHWRTGKRGALGNGLRAVMGGLYCLGGHLDVETRGAITRLRVTDNGDVTHENLGSSDREGTRLTVHCKDIAFAVDFAKIAVEHKGDSITAALPSPNWFDVDAIRDLQRSAEGETTADFVAQFGTKFKPFNPRLLTDCDPANLLECMQAEAMSEPMVIPLGDVYEGEYVKEAGTYDIGDATLPFVIEVWALAERADNGETGAIDASRPIINRSKSLTGLSISRADKGRLRIAHAGYWEVLPKAERDKYTLRTSVNYEFLVAITAPYVPILSSGKAPDISDLICPILRCVGKAGKKAHNGLKRQTTGVKITDAVFSLLPAAYEALSVGGQYWANARQLMYEMRPDILRMCGREKFSDDYITQTLLPEFMAANPELTEGWLVAYDNRGNLIEPHTGETVGLGTVAVAGYTETRPRMAYDRAVSRVGLLSDLDPEHRFRGLLFIEKEGFTELVTTSGILERFDLALASTKGMSNTAVRTLIDDMAGRHSDFMLYTVSDFDITGQSIHHTLTNDTGRYQFRNKVHNKHLGVTWEQAQKLHAEGRSEPVAVASVKATSADLLLERGLDPDAVEFLTGLKPRRVEVNALRPAQFLEMIRKGIGSPRKLIPPDPVLADAYQELTVQHRLRALEAELRDGDAPDVPDGLMVDVIDELGGNPDQSWDQAILRIIEGGIQ